MGHSSGCNSAGADGLRLRIELMPTVDLTQIPTQLTGGLTLLVITIWIVSRIGESRRKIIVDEHGGNPIETI